MAFIFQNFNIQGNISLVTNFVPMVAPSTVEYLVVGGGGGGFLGKTGTYWGGGGGAGQVLSGSSLAVSTSTPYTVTIGAGGAEQPSLDMNGYSGNSSVFSSITATGGGGGLYNTGYGGTSGNGFIGGAPGGSPTAGGGGGAGAAGSGQNGGNGITSSITGSSTYYGGGGSAANDSGTPGTPGLGGGGTGSTQSVNSNIINRGAVNTGGGGGGGDYGFGNGNFGGSGIVVIRYPDTYASAANTIGSPNIIVSGGYRIYKWTSSGSITF